MEHSVEDTIVGAVERIAPGGRALLRTPDGVVFARGGLPGERVRVRIERAARGVRHGVVLEVLDRSPDRVTPDCPLHPRCGGCDLLDLAATASAQVKLDIVKDALLRVGKLDAATLERALLPLRAPPTGDGAQQKDATRRRATFVLRGGAPTFSAPDSHARVPIERCPALHPTLQGALPLLRAMRGPDGVRVQLACDERPGAVLAVERDRALAASFVAVGGRGAVVTATEERLGDPSLVGEVSAGALPCLSDAGVFAQATRFGGRAILDEVLRAAAVQPGERVLELFCGSGHLTAPLLAAGAHVEAIEGDERAARFCRENASLIGASARAEVRVAFIDQHLEVSAPPDVVIADPPRTGIPGLAALAERLTPRAWVLVACDPATGARDLAALLAHGWQLASLTPIDAFPRTTHVEWVARLDRPR